MAQLLRSNVEQHVLPAGIVLSQALSKVAHRRGEFPVRAAELFEEQ